MRNNEEKNAIRIVNSFRLSLAGAAALLACICLPAEAKDQSDKAEHYQQVNLVSDQPNVAMVHDTNLVNAWGISFSSTSPFWVSENGTGKSTLYAVTNDASASTHVTKSGLEASTPGEGTPTAA